MTRLDLGRIRAAARVIDPVFLDTPQFGCPPLSAALGVLVEEDSIKRGMRELLDLDGLVVEPSAALGIAAILEDRERFAGREVATVVCGSNVMSADLRRWALEPHGLVAP
jgi:threonine synthase